MKMHFAKKLYEARNDMKLYEIKNDITFIFNLFLYELFKISRSINMNFFNIKIASTLGIRTA